MIQCHLSASFPQGRELKAGQGLIVGLLSHCLFQNVGATIESQIQRKTKSKNIFNWMQIQNHPIHCGSSWVSNTGSKFESGSTLVNDRPKLDLPFSWKFTRIPSRKQICLDPDLGELPLDRTFNLPIESSSVLLKQFPGILT